MVFIAQLMNLDASTEEQTSRIDLDSLLRSYSQALQKEIAVTDLVSHRVKLYIL